MNDIQAGRDINVGGNLIVEENSTQDIKPLALCTAEELTTERQHRIKLLADERERKSSTIHTLFLFVFVVGVGIAIWNFFVGEVTAAMFLLGVVGVFIPLVAAYQTSNEETEFEQRQIAALSEIKHLLRERGLSF